jgi:hypothetical protein
MIITSGEVKQEIDRLQTDERKFKAATSKKTGQNTLGSCWIFGMS